MRQAVRRYSTFLGRWAVRVYNYRPDARQSGTQVRSPTIRRLMELQCGNWEQAAQPGSGNLRVTNTTYTSMQGDEVDFSGGRYEAHQIRRYEAHQSSFARVSEVVFAVTVTNVIKAVSRVQ